MKNKIASTKRNLFDFQNLKNKKLNNQNLKRLYLVKRG